MVQILNLLVELTMNMKCGKIKNIFKRHDLFGDRFFFSILENMLKNINQLGTTYYPPILDNYPKYESLRVQENVVIPNTTETLTFSSGIDEGETRFICLCESLIVLC